MEISSTGYVVRQKIIDFYPKRTPKIDKSVPANIANDYIEAIKCFDVGAPKASVAMCRRALQSSVVEKGATKDKLNDQIDELCDKGIITKDIREWAHEIRFMGNIGAHPDKDGLKDVTLEDAQEMLEFVEQYLNYVYIMPSRVITHREKRKVTEKPKVAKVVEKPVTKKEVGKRTLVV
jgi:hypothetical protein